jgi:hypothetical protein
MYGLLLLLLVSLGAQAQIIGVSRILLNSTGANADLTGVGRYSGGSSCTAFWVESEGPAVYALTNGHCISTASANDILLDRPSTARVTFHYFRDTRDRQLAVPVRRTLYSTMKGRDLAILELDTTREALLGAGIRPLRVSTRKARTGEPIRIAGAPVTGVPAEEAFLREARCEAGEPVDLIEFIWQFRNALPNRCSDIFGGSSGSPMLSLESGLVVGILNTGNAGVEHVTGDYRCFLNQPCEVTAEGFRYREDTNYGLDITDLGACLTAGRIDECPLDRSPQMSLSSTQRAAQSPARWNVGLSSQQLTHYRYKSIRQGADDCRDPRGYGTVRAVAEEARITDTLPEQEGHYHLCVLGGATATPDATWQQPDAASIVLLRVDNTPPTVPLRYLLTDLGEQYLIDPIFQIPEYSHFRYKVAETAADTCDRTEGYRNYLRIAVRIPKRDNAYRMCVIGYDDADNPTPPLELLLDGPQLIPDPVRNAASYRSGVQAPGSWITVLGVNLDTPEVRLIDSAGVNHPLATDFAATTQINVRLPESAALGTGRLRLDELETPIVVGPAPGEIFFTEQMRTPLTAPVDLVLYVNGTAAPKMASFCTVGVEIVEARPQSEGVTAVTVRIPESFPCRGFLPLVVESEAGKSAPRYLRLRDTTGL